MSNPFPKFWKGEQQDYDDLLSTEDRSFCFCLSERSAKMLLAFTLPMHWKTRYYSDTGLEIDADLVDEWASLLEAELIQGLNDMCGCCGGGGLVLSRIEDGVVQVSNDGGETWTDAPGNDPRETSLYVPLGNNADPDNDVQRCNVAANGTANLQDFINTAYGIVNAGGALTAVVAALGAVVAVFMTGGFILPVMAGLAAALIELGGSSILGAFDATFYDCWRCALYCRQKPGGSFEADDIASIKADLEANCPGAASTVASLILDVLGSVGLTNWGRVGGGAGTGECDDCDDCPDCAAASANVFTWNTTPDVIAAGWMVTGGTTETNARSYGAGYAGSTLTFTHTDGDVRICSFSLLNSITPVCGGCGVRAQIDIEGGHFQFPNEGGGALVLNIPVVTDRFTMSVFGNPSYGINVHALTVNTEVI